MLRKTPTFLMIGSALSLSIAASGCNKQPVKTVSSHPAASSFECEPEPAALTDEQVMADQFGTLEREFETAAIMSARSCHDAIARLCQWHKDRGMEEPKSCAPPPPKPVEFVPSDKPERG